MTGANAIAFLIGCGFRASIPLAAAWAATRLVSRWSAATRHFIWAWAIAIALLLPLAAIVMPRWSVATPAPVARLASIARQPANPPRVPNVAPGELASPAIGKPEDGSASGLRPWTIATWIWVTGAVGVLSYVLIGHFAAWRLYRTTRKIEHSWLRDAQRLAKQEGLSDRLHIVESAAVSTPVVLHLRYPIVVMPQAAGRWSTARIRAVLLHEFAHIKRNDFYTQTLAQFACAVYWFNPLLWLAAHQLRLERERACDDFVVTSGTSGADYAADLLEIACGRSNAAVARFAIGLAERRSQLEQRILAVVNPRTPRRRTTFFGKCMVAFATSIVALAAGAVQIKAREIQVPIGQIRVPIPAIQVRSGEAELSSGGKQPMMHSVSTNSNAEGNSEPEEFHWSAPMHEHQSVEVYLGRGSIQVLPSTNETVRVQAYTDTSYRSEIKAVPTSSGVKFCNIVTTARESRNYCEPNSQASGIEQNQPATELVIYLPAGVYFSGSTVVGDITAQHPGTDSNLATIAGNVTLELAPEQSASFNGNVIDGTIDSDVPLNDNAPSLPNGERPVKAPRIVHAIVGSDGPRLSAMVVKGNIRLLRRPAE